MPPTRRRLQAAKAPARRAPNLRESVETSIAAMGHLTPQDQALADLARSLADQIEAAQERAELAERVMQDAAGDPGIFRRLQKLEAMCDLTKTVGWLGPQLRHVLADLTGEPSKRKQSKPAEPVGGLASLRARTAQRTTGTPGA